MCVRWPSNFGNLLRPDAESWKIDWMLDMCIAKEVMSEQNSYKLDM